MPIYPDKKDGQTTGRWRVELKRSQAGQQERYRKRHDTYEEAQDDEKRVQALWASGEAVQGAPEIKARRTCLTLSEGLEEAEGSLWDGKSCEATGFAHLKAVRDILGPNILLDEIDTLAVDKVIKALKKQGKADGTVNRYVSHLRTFLVWCCSRKHRSVPIHKDTIEFTWQEEFEGRIRWLTYEEEDKLLTLVPENVGNLIRVALATGCRRDELLTARRDQINGTRLHLWGKTATTRTKTRTSRTVPMSPETTAMLTDLIVSGTMPSKRNLRSWWDRAKTKMGLDGDDDFVFHACRHTCATRLLDAGVNILVIKDWLGHKRIETTQRYTHVKPQNLEDALVLVGTLRRDAGKEANNNKQLERAPTVPTGGDFGHFSAAA